MKKIRELIKVLYLGIVGLRLCFPNENFFGFYCRLLNDCISIENATIFVVATFLVIKNILIF